MIREYIGYLFSKKKNTQLCHLVMNKSQIFLTIGDGMDGNYNLPNT